MEHNIHRFRLKLKELEPLCKCLFISLHFFINRGNVKNNAPVFSICNPGQLKFLQGPHKIPLLIINHPNFYVDIYIPRRFFTYFSIFFQCFIIGLFLYIYFSKSIVNKLILWVYLKYLFIDVYCTIIFFLNLIYKSEAFHYLDKIGVYLKSLIEILFGFCVKFYTCISPPKKKKPKNKILRKSRRVFQ